MSTKKNRFPEGWDLDRVQQVLSHYEEQTEEEAITEDEAAFEDAKQTMMAIPVELVPAIRELLAEYYSGSQLSNNYR